MHVSTINDADLDEVLRLAYPQGVALLRLENGIELLNHGARQLVTNPRLAVVVLGPHAARKLAYALRAVGERHVAVAETMIEMAAGAESEPVMPHSRRPAPPKEPD
jgi:hypothetical protein